MKWISWFNTNDNDLHVVTLDFNICDGTDSNITRALDFNFKKIDHVTDNDEKTTFNVQETDAWGGGTSHGLWS